MSVQDHLLTATRWPVIGRVAYLALKTLGVEFPRSVEWAGPIELAHGAVGLVVHRATVLGSRITLMPGVVIGRADAHEPLDPTAVGRVVVGNHVVLGAGAKVLFRTGQELVIGDGTVVGANSVLLTSTGEGEVWAGAPARRVGARVG